MSENLNRSHPDFSKYDSMSIGELEEILRADAQGPERDDSDVDEILYVMEVLVKKRRQNGIAGKTALEAYQEFKQYYPPVSEEKDIESAPTRKATVIPFRRIAAIAASLVLVFTVTTSANAFGLKDIWNAVARWAEETFSFSMDTEASEPKVNDELKYGSLQDILAHYDRSFGCIPTWIPDGFELQDIVADINPIQETYIAVYSNGDRRFKISIQSFLDNRSEQIEMSGGLTEIYTISDINFYLFSNLSQIRAVWLVDSYECYISGELSLDDIKAMIDSIEKG